MDRRTNTIGAFLVMVLLAVGMAEASTPGDCGPFEPRDGRQLTLYIPFAVDQVPGARFEVPAENFYLCEIGPHFAADSELGIPPFIYSELAATSATLSLMFPGEFTLLRTLPQPAGGEESCVVQFSVNQDFAAHWPYPPPLTPESHLIGPRLEWSFAENEFHLAAQDYARRNQTLILRNTGDMNLEIHDIFQGVENSKLFIFPIEFEPGTTIGPGGQLAIDFDYYAINDRLLLVSPVLYNPMIVVTNDPIRPVVPLLHRVHVHQTAEDFPEDKPPFRTVRLCKPSQDPNDDGIIDSADQVFSLQQNRGG